MSRIRIQSPNKFDNVAVFFNRRMWNLDQVGSTDSSNATQMATPAIMMNHRRIDGRIAKNSMSKLT